MLTKALLIIIIAYLLLVALCFFMQKRVIYPASQAPIAQCDLPQGVEVFAANQNGQELHGIMHQTGSRKLLVFFHGNGETACSWRFLGQNHVAKYGYDTLVMEYPGYASVGGGLGIKPNRAMVAGLASWLEGEDYDEIVVMGYSLGTAMASMLAPQIEADGLILFAPFDRMRNVFHDQLPIIPKFIITENYQSDVALEDYEGAAIIVYGGKDILIRPARSMALAQTLRDVEIIEYADGQHQTLLADQYLDPVLAKALAGGL